MFGLKGAAGLAFGGVMVLVSARVPASGVCGAGLEDGLLAETLVGAAGRADGTALGVFGATAAWVLMVGNKRSSASPKTMWKFFIV